MSNCKNNTNADNLPDYVKFLQKLFEQTIGATYPKHILKRRLGFLSKKEKAKCDKIWQRIVFHVEEIEEIIAERAEKEKVPWE